MSSLKCNKQGTRDVFRDGNKWSKVWQIIYLKILKQGEMCGWCVCKQTKTKGTVDAFWG